MKVNQITQESRFDRRDAYQRDYDSSVSGMGRGDDHRGLRQELAHERNNIQIAINGRPWKVVAGRGTADSAEERNHLESMKQWAERKSASSGKKWTVYLTGAEVSEDATNSQITEFATAPGGGDSGNYFQALASAWYNGTFDSGSLEKGIKSQQDVERLLQRGIVCPDGVTRKYGIDYNSDFDGVVISSDDYYEHADHDETDSRTGKPFGPYDYMEFGGEELDESAKWRDPKYKDKLYTQEPPDYNDTREYDNAMWYPKPKGYKGRKEPMAGGEFPRTDPLVKGFGRYGVGEPVSKGPRKGLPSRDQITSLKGSIKDAHGKHHKPNLPEQGVAEGKADYNFDAEDLKRLERIRDLPTLKAQALALIAKPSAKPMKPEKVEWFKNALENMNSPLKVIKLMYDLLLSGEGNSVIGTKSSMNPNSYRQRFNENDMEEGVLGTVGGAAAGMALGGPLGAAIGAVGGQELTSGGSSLIELDKTGEYDQEGNMAQQDLTTASDAASELRSILSADENLPEWVQAKITKAVDYLDTARDYMKSEKHSVSESMVSRMQSVNARLSTKISALK